MLTPLTNDDPVMIGPYRLQNRIGEGGMGTVYLAFTAGRQPVAVKVASAELSEDDEFRRRFQREVRAAQRVRGGAVAAVLDADTGSERPWMVTEYVEGISLADAVRQRGPLAERLVRGLAAGLADALVAIHEVGVVHRDLKPSNILLAWDGPKVIDFGIAQLDGNATLTRTGHVVGTLAWMAPEQMRGEQAGPPADIFSWGCCVAYAATGRHPFHADRAEVLAFRIQRDPPDLDRLPGYLFGTVAPALEKDPRLRPSAVALLADLSGRPVRSMSEAHRATETVLERDWAGRVPGIGERRSSSSHGEAGQSGQGAWVPSPAQPPSGSWDPPARPSPPPSAPARARPAAVDRSTGAPHPSQPSAAAPLPPARSRPAEDADWRVARAGSLGPPPPAEAFRPSPPRPGPAMGPWERQPLAIAGPDREQDRAVRPPEHGGNPEPAPRQASAHQEPTHQASVHQASTYREPAYPDPAPPAARAGPAPPARGAAGGAGPARPGPPGAPARGGSRARGGERSHRSPRAGWNLPALFSALLAVAWLFGVGSALGIYLGYQGRAAASRGRRRGDRLAAVGILLGWPGVLAAIVLLGIVAAG
ncbi:protein kinase [Frankia sp. CNm7]|uniref:serine/threonine-protein kinase n=1 Tax=Frankia nepalensis TaxID=1836974 RepID=UPI0019348D1A|nr:serine/threonine-protein kinase [Frankia nepalensis]MBL7524011.1 protein kinase [Frankia nepalensis]